MLSDSNYFILSNVKLKRSEREKRLEFLNNTVSTLRAYKIKARRDKIRTIERLIIKYQDLLDRNIK